MTMGMPGGIASNAYGTAPGGAGTVQGTPQNQSGLASLFGANPVASPNAAASSGIMDTANGLASGYAAGANGGFVQAAPTISNPYQAQDLGALAVTNNAIGGIGNLLTQTANGGGPAQAAAKATIQQGVNQSIAAQTAMARSATGGPLAQNAAQLSAQGNNAATIGQAGATAAQTQAGMAATAAGQAGQLLTGQAANQLGEYNANLGNAQQQAALNLQNQGQQNQMQLGLGGLGAQEQGIASNALNAYNSAELGAETQQNTQNQQGLQNFGAAANGIASMAAGGMG